VADTLTIFQPGTSLGAGYTAPSARIVTAASVCGAGGGSSLTAAFVHSGGSAGEATMQYRALVVPDGGESPILDAYLNVPLAKGDAIHFLAADAATLTVTIGTRDA